MPNVFTPNNDQVNDFFLPIKVLGITISHLTVINRWGEIVFETTDPIDHWNGSHRGYECTSGVYFWILEYSKSDNSTHTIHGNVHLIR